MIIFSNYVENIKSHFKKEQLKAFDSIVEYDALQLASGGHNDTEGYQIFTPDFIVKDMCKAVGKEILDFTKTILEPTSGDGAFTTYIYQKRLNEIKSEFEIESLRALSTIYSIEMDKELIEKQRNNIFTLLKQFIKKKNVEVDSSFYDLVKCILCKNFIWGMFNTEHSDGLLLGVDVVYRMPEAEKGKLIAVDMPVWEISQTSVDVHDEGVDLW